MPNKTYVEVVTSKDKEEEEQVRMLNIERILGSRMNNMPKNISTYIRTLADNSTWQNFCEISEALKWLHKHPQPGITIYYEAKFNYKLRCQDKSPTCTTFANFGCRCQLLYSFKKGNIDLSAYVPHKFRGKLITPFLLMDYGLLHKL